MIGVVQRQYRDGVPGEVVVTEQNIAQFFKQGADAVAFGAGILRMDWLEQDRFDLIEERLNLLIKSYKASNDIRISE